MEFDTDVAKRVVQGGYISHGQSCCYNNLTMLWANPVNRIQAGIAFVSLPPPSHPDFRTLKSQSYHNF